MRVHDFCRVFVVTKGVKSNIKIPVVVDHVKVDIASVPSSFAFAVLDQSSLPRYGDTNKVSLVQGDLTQTHCIHF